MTTPLADLVSELRKELRFTVSRSAGPGGQNVNKVNSKVTLRFDVARSRVLTEEQKLRIQRRLTSQINSSGFLVVTAQESRSQHENREVATKKFEKLIAQAFIRRKVRKHTKPTNSSVKARLEQKKRHSDKKRRRGERF